MVVGRYDSSTYADLLMSVSILDTRLAQNQHAKLQELKQLCDLEQICFDLIAQ